MLMIICPNATTDSISTLWLYMKMQTIKRSKKLSEWMLKYLIFQNVIFIQGREIKQKSLFFMRNYEGTFIDSNIFLSSENGLINKIVR